MDVRADRSESTRGNSASRLSAQPETAHDAAFLQGVDLPQARRIAQLQEKADQHSTLRSHVLQGKFGVGVVQLAKHNWDGTAWIPDGGSSSSNAKAPKERGDFVGQVFDDDTGTYTLPNKDKEEASDDSEDSFDDVLLKPAEPKPEPLSLEEWKIGVCLQIEKPKASKKLVLNILNRADDTIASCETNSGTCKTVAQHTIGRKTDVVGKYPIPDPSKALHNVFEKSRKELEGKATTELARRKFMESLEEKEPAQGFPSQTELFHRLLGFHDSENQDNAKGHDKIPMTRIPLLKPVLYEVGERTFKITHLYTQRGNETEIRCYLGDELGAYQRVHTSLTVEEKKTPTAHTMVQTGSELAVPPISKGGIRVGFDTTETKSGIGFAARKPSPRSKVQCTVNGYITGQNFLDLSELDRAKAMELANSFNKTLDQVCQDMMLGEISMRVISKATPQFKPHDEGGI